MNALRRGFTGMLAGAALCMVACTRVAPPVAAVRATAVVATADSAPESRALARFVGDGVGDQEEINAAIRSLPPAGGTVLLMEGTYDIRRVPGRLGGVLIERSNVTLAGQGTGTRLVQAPRQMTNVVRIQGTAVGNVVVRDLLVDANRDANPDAPGDPRVSHARFEYCGIKALSGVPGRSDLPCHDITVRGVTAVNARALNIMLVGRNVRVIDCHLGNATSDSVELLGGPGQVSGTYVAITGRTHVAIGSDRGDSITMANNTVHVLKGGDLDIAFRSWAESRRHVIAGNVVTVDAGGRLKAAMDVRGAATVVSGNIVQGRREAPVGLLISGGAASVTGNVLQNTAVEVNVPASDPRPVILRGNVLDGSTVRRLSGTLITD